MPTELKLPRLGQGMTEGKILRWLKQEGDKVAKGDEIYEVETEKVDMAVESPAAGILIKIVASEGSEVPVGTVVAYVGKKGDAVPDAAPAKEAKPAAVPSDAGSGPEPVRASEPAQTSQPQTAPQASSPTRSDGRVKASPLARRIASERGVDLASISGSGPEGRIVARDLEGASAAGPRTAAPGAVNRIPLSTLRKTIVRRLGEAWTAPVFYLTVSIDMQRANELRARAVGMMAAGEVKPSVSDLITKVAAAALRKHPEVNAHFDTDAIVQHADVHIGMAVATDGGLLVPVIRDAHARSLQQIAAERKRVVDLARAGKLTPADMEGGTFTISNLGMMGVEEFTAVLNPPMAAILAIGATRDQVVAVDGAPTVRPMMTVTLGCDHRALDGAVGARFLQTLKSFIEEPALLALE